MLQVDGGNLDLELSIFGNRYSAGLLADYNADGIGDLTHSQGGPMPETKVLGYIHVVANREDTSDRHDAMGGYNHRPVMKG